MHLILLAWCCCHVGLNVLSKIIPYHISHHITPYTISHRITNHITLHIISHITCNHITNYYSLYSAICDLKSTFIGMVDPLSDVDKWLSCFFSCTLRSGFVSYSKHDNSYLVIYYTWVNDMKESQRHGEKKLYLQCWFNVLFFRFLSLDTCLSVVRKPLNLERSEP